MIFNLRTRPVEKSDDTRRSLALFNWNAGLRVWYDSIIAITGFVFVDYALALGVSKEKIGYLASVASLACFAQLAGLLCLNSIREKKPFAIRISYLEPLFMMIMFVGVFFVPTELRLPLIALGIMLSAASLHVVKPILDEWLASAIPESIRGRYISRRMQIVSVVSIAATLAVGFVTQRLRGFGSEGYGVLLLAGGLFGLLSVFMLRGAAMPTSSESTRVSWSSIPEVLKHRPFMKCLAATLIYNVPFWLAVPYYQVFHLKILGLREFAISWMMTGYFILKILLLPLGGRLLDRLGTRKLIYLISPIYLVFFLLYTIASPERSWTVFAAWIVIGIAEGGFGVAATSALYSTIPESTARPAYFAFYNLVTFLMAAAGAAFAAWMVGALAHTSLTIGPFHLYQYQLLYGVSFLTLIPCILGTQLYPGKESPAQKSQHTAETS